MAHDEEQERLSAVKQKPVDSLKNTHFCIRWVVAPRRWILSFEGWVGNVANRPKEQSELMFRTL